MQHRLVDRLGDFYTAIDTAKELMGLAPSRVVPVFIIRPPRAVTIGRRSALGMLDAAEMLLREGVLALMPWEIRLR
jgi:hypothetical protein